MSDEPAKVTGAPSAWSSENPAAGLHAHPLPRIVRLMLVAYGLLLGVTFAAIVWLVLSSQSADHRARVAVVHKVERDIAAAQRAQTLKDAVDAERTRRAVCTVLRESITPGDGTRALAHQLRCGLPPASPVPGVDPVPAPAPSRTVAAGRSAPAPVPRPEPHPSASTRPPTPPRSPSPKPTPTRSCLVVVLGRCVQPPGRG